MSTGAVLQGREQRYLPASLTISLWKHLPSVLQQSLVPDTPPERKTRRAAGSLASAESSRAGQGSWGLRAPLAWGEGRSDQLEVQSPRCSALLWRGLLSGRPPGSVASLSCVHQSRLALSRGKRLEQEVENM